MHPYESLPDHAFWRRSVVGAAEVDPVVAPPFLISQDELIATAGSCFAQHIARHLKRRGFKYFIAEPPHPLLSDDAARDFNYGTYTCRYGNIYTSLQLKQLLQRAYGEFVPAEPEWQGQDGRWIDPFRPQIQPHGFMSVEELREDRAQHLEAVRSMVESMDVFVFTLGLTECWLSRQDGAVFPVCPGVAGGGFDDSRYVFRNLSVAAVVADMEWVLDFLRNARPSLKVILTVSPVPLMATAAEDRHVLTATTYSKSVLRVAAEELSQNDEALAYFPSFEIVTGPSSRGAYFAADLRSVTETGVEHVMRSFIRNFAAELPPGAEAPPAGDAYVDTMEAVVQANCDEEALDWAG
ncbi:MAG: GSCFA domain-containing protein [Candidatus Nanopelagicales bacterium]